MTLRIGFYGAGLISHMHTWFLASSAVDHSIVAVCEPDPARASAFAERHGARVVGEEELLDLVDVVYVTTWTSEHARLVRAATERGLAVFCEKPLATEAGTVAGMVDVVESAGIVNQVGLLLRYVPAFVYARHLVSDPRAGRLLAVAFRDDQFIPNQGHYASTWRVDPALCGRGALLEHSIHDVDVLRWICGPVAAVSATMREVHGYERIDDVAVARLEFTGGGVASLTSIWHDILERPSMRHVEIFCERLYVGIDPEANGRVAWQLTGSPGEELEGSAVVDACIAAGAAPTDETVPFLGTPVFNPATAFLAAVRDRAPSPLPFREALPAHRIVDAIYASADGGGAVVPVE